MTASTKGGAQLPGHRKTIRAAVLGVLFVLTALAPVCAYAYCADICLLQQNGLCVDTQHYCTEDDSKTAPASSYGAIAYGRTSKAWGASYHWESQSKAESVAMQKCKENGDDCEVMVWFKGQCGAVAAGEGTNAFWGLGGSAAQARAQAQSKCEEGGGKGCEIEASECSR